PLEDRINYALYNDVNPSLAAHGGNVSLAEVTDDMIAVLKFGGRCQGCGAVAVTLKQGIEVQLMDKLPELKGIRDVTDHTDRSNAYIEKLKIFLSKTPPSGGVFVSVSRYLLHKKCSADEGF